MSWYFPIPIYYVGTHWDEIWPYWSFSFWYQTEYMWMSLSCLHLSLPLTSYQSYTLSCAMDIIGVISCFYFWYTHLLCKWHWHCSSAHLCPQSDTTYNHYYCPCTRTSFYFWWPPFFYTTMSSRPLSYCCLTFGNGGGNYSWYSLRAIFCFQSDINWSIRIYHQLTSYSHLQWPKKKGSYQN